MVNIAISKYEGNLHDELDDIISEISDIEESLVKNTDKIAKVAMDVIKDVTTDDIDEACYAFKKFDVQLRGKASLVGMLWDDGDIEYKVSFKINNTR